MKKLNNFSYTYLSGLFSYDPKTGIITRRKNHGKGRKGAIVGSLEARGYLHVCVDYSFILIHRLGYFLHTKDCPRELDHKNRIKTDNRFSNLRPCSRKDNSGNNGLIRTNTSGFRGVSRNTRSGLWHAQIKIEGKQTYLGRFTTKYEAAKAYNEAAKKHFGKFAVLNEVV